MKKTIWLAVFLLSLASKAKADTVVYSLNELKNDVSSLASQCGYVLSGSVVTKISRASLKARDELSLFDFYLSIRPVDRKIEGKLSFGCFAAGSTMSTQNEVPRPTASEEISRADSGGRYARNVVWQRAFKGTGWVGTIAYVNSVFGDQTELSAPDFFLICPDKGKWSCFSFEVNGVKLRKKESDRIPELLRGVLLKK